LGLQFVSGAAIFQALILLEKKHQRRADRKPAFDSNLPH